MLEKTSISKLEFSPAALSGNKEEGEGGGEGEDPAA